MKRRSFIKVLGLAGGGLSVGFLVDGCAHVSGGQAIGGGFHPNAWVRITPDGVVHFLLDRAEMGQGIMTSHTQLLAEELEVKPDSVKVEFAPADYDAYGVQLTGGSTSTTSQWDVIRQAGATARELLKKAAARRWGISVDDVTAENGTLSSSKGKLSYGEVASDAAHESVGDVKLKEPSAFKVIGKSIRRLDAPAKVDGTAVFGIDVQVPGLLTAVVLRPPVLRGIVKSFDADKARAVRGVVRVLEIPQGIAVVANSYWQAKKAAALVDIEWDHGAMASFSSEGLRKKHFAMLKEEGNVVVDTGDVTAALKSASKTVRGVYEVPFVSHATMEPMNATAHVEHIGPAVSKCTIWAPTQAPTIAQEVAARMLGLPHKDVNIITTFAGGGFGRRALADFVGEAVIISKTIRAPVKVMWSREDDMHHGQYRPAAVSYLEGGVGPDGMPVAWSHKMTGQSLMAAFANLMGAMAPEMVPRPIMDLVGAGVGKLFVDGHLTDPTAVEGASDQPYKLPNAKVELALFDSGVPVFPWRSVGHSINGFVVESFMDEMAHLGGKDPVALRRTLLGDNKRALGVLNAAAEGIGWDRKPPPGRFRGIAQHACFGSVCAHAMEISVDGGLRVHRVVSAIDCGQAVNPDLVAAQMESGVIYALSAAFSQRIDFDAGQVRQSNFHDYPLLRMSQAPVIETHIIPSTERPTGVGELAVPPVAPALANAIFAATGVRLRRLPLLPDLELVLAGKKPAEVTL